MVEQRNGEFIATYTGKKFYPLDPRVEDVDVNDIIHSLSNLCRFNGHCQGFYTVAQHCVLVSHSCDPKDALWGLLHDASEAYIADIPSPLKRCKEFEMYRKFERQLMNVICAAFDMEPDEPKSVSIADKRILATEARDLTMTEGRGWSIDAEPYEFHIKPWSSELAKAKFLSRFHELIKKRGNSER